MIRETVEGGHHLIHELGNLQDDLAMDTSTLKIHPCDSMHTTPKCPLPFLHPKQSHFEAPDSLGPAVSAAMVLRMSGGHPSRDPWVFHRGRLCGHRGVQFHLSGCR